MNQEEIKRDATINDYLDAIDLKLSEARDFADRIHSSISWVDCWEPKKDSPYWLLEKMKLQLEGAESLRNTLNAITKFI